MNFTLKIWRQKGAKSKGAFESYKVENISADTSFLEMLDILNNNLIHEGKEPVAFDHDCREGICGMCSLHIDGQAHGPSQGATTCQIYMRKFKDGATITIEPWRSAAFPVIKDLVVNRSAYDQILQAGGFISVRTNSVPDANAIPIAQADAEESMDAAACIGCGGRAATSKGLFPRGPPGSPWPPPPASAAEPAPRRARTVRPCSSSPPACRRSPNCPRAVSRVRAAPRRWSPRWTNWASATAPTREPARPSAPSRFPLRISPV